MKKLSLVIVTMVSVLASGCSKQPEAGSGLEQRPAGESGGAPTQQTGPLIAFDFHDPQWGCGREDGSAFGCLMSACTAAGGRWDSAGFQCMCDEGVIFTQGSRAECQVALNGQLMPGSSLAFLRPGAELYERTVLSRTPTVSRIGGAAISIGPRFGLGWYRSPKHFERILNRQAEGYGHDRPDLGDVMFNKQDLVLDSVDELETAMVRVSFAQRERPRVELGIFQSSLYFVPGTLDAYAGVLALSEPKVLFASRSGGCAAGCRVAFDLPAPEGYRARLVRDYAWGSIGFEAIEVAPAAMIEMEEPVQIVLLPSGKVSHLQGHYLAYLAHMPFPFVINSHGQLIGTLPGSEP
jgi:hypothetical protein